MRKFVKIDYTISGFDKFAIGEIIEENDTHLIIKLFDESKRRIKKECINELVELSEEEVRRKQYGFRGFSTKY